jgi:flagellar protein FliO/FliZ
MQSVELVGRLLVSLLAVLVVIWLLGRKLRKGGRLKDSKLIDVLGRQQLTRNAAIAVVRVGDNALVVGVTDNQVNVLGETDLAAAQAAVSSMRPSEPASAHRRGAARRRGLTAPAALGPDALAQQALAQQALAQQAQQALAQQLLAQQALAQQAMAASTPSAPLPAGTASTPLPPLPADAHAALAAATSAGPLAGSALSPQTWRQTIESLRELTTR